MTDRSTETADETEARLQQDRESHRERRSTQTTDETEARLQHDRERHRERRSTEMADETVARLQRNRHRYRSSEHWEHLISCSSHYTPMAVTHHLPYS